MKFFIPEVVQTSNMDCGPAALKSLLEGFGIPVNYGRLREACQTDVDGTSIDTMEEVANQLGLEAEQIMLPADHVLLPEARALPAIAVIVLPSGITHFVVVWNRRGDFVQLMDPATGRRWTTCAQFLRDLYIHKMTVVVSGWREYAASDDFRGALLRRLENLGIWKQKIPDDPGWENIAAFDAAARFTESLADSGAISRGHEASAVFERFLDHPESIPEHCWSVRPSDSVDRLIFRGAILVRALGRSADPSRAPASPELVAALAQPPAEPGRELLRLLRAGGALLPSILSVALVIASAGVIFEAVLFRRLLDIHRQNAILLLLGFSAALLAIDVPLTAGLLQLGRSLEMRLRQAFFRKIPRLGDRYFQSRLKSDMAERSHSIHLIRRLPELAGQLLRYIFEIVFTTAGIIWLDPHSAPLAILAALAAIVIPLVSQPLLMERDLRVRTHSGAISHFYLDALLGLVAIHTHGAQRAVRRSHETLLHEWTRAGFHLQRAVIALESVQFFIGFGLAIWLLGSQLGRTAGPGALLLVYWALNLPALGQEIAVIAWQYPAFRNVTLRLLEPLGAIEHRSTEAAAVATPTQTTAASIVLEHVTVTAGGHTVLADIDLTIAPGEHIAIVGPSGAGKSSLVGLLLGWHRPASGRIVVDGRDLDEQHLDQLRAQTAWVDPAVQIWNRPLAANLQYGLAGAPRMTVDEAIDAAELRRVLERLPDSLATALGEGGGLISGGEGQRVRFGRALLRTGVRLVILDEPFRGLDLDQRRALLQRARHHWRDATLLSISHDVSETLTFDRVLVLESGHIVEDSKPAVLRQQETSRFRAMLQAEHAAREGLWSASEWRHLRLDGGKLVEL